MKKLKLVSLSILAGVSLSFVLIYLIIGQDTGVRLDDIKVSNQTASRLVSPHGLNVSLALPAGGEEFNNSDIIEVKWFSNYQGPGKLTFYLFYTTDAGRSWLPIAAGIQNTSYIVRSVDLLGTDVGMFRIIGTDGVNASIDDSGIFKVVLKPPKPYITSPPKNSNFSSIETINFKGKVLPLQNTSFDRYGKYFNASSLGWQLEWQSDKQGMLGRGDSISFTGLKPGTHTITLKVIEKNGLSDSETINIQVLKNNKVIILTFADNRKGQYTNAKPILDRYGFKATFYVVCNDVGKHQGYMNWEEIERLYKEGHDIGSHSMNHNDLGKLSKKKVEFEVGGSKKCLDNHGIKATSFAYPSSDGSNNKTVVNIVAKHYDLARTTNDPLMYLQCNGLEEEESSQTDCRIYTDDGDLTYANRYTIRGWSQDYEREENSYNNSQMLDKFIEVVDSQDEYNKDGIKAIPIIIYHKVDDIQDGYNTDIDLFEAEMKYLDDNHFRVLTMADLAYDEKSNFLYLKKFRN